MEKNVTMQQVDANDLTAVEGGMTVGEGIISVVKSIFGTFGGGTTTTPSSPKTETSSDRVVTH